MKRVVQFIKLYLLFLALFEAGRLYFILYNFKLFSDHFLIRTMQSALYGFRLDMSAASYCLLPVFTVFLLEGIFRKQAPKIIYKILFSIELTLIAAITISDPELFIQWGNKFNNQVLVYINHPMEMALSSGSANWLKTILFILLFIPLLIFIYRKLVKTCEKSYTFSWQYFTVLVLNPGLCFLFLRGGTGIATISQASAIYSSNYADNSAAVNSLWNAAYYIVYDNEALYGKEHRFAGENEAVELLKKQLQGDSTGIRLSDQTRPNVIVVMLESFTANASMYFSGNSDCTPNLDKLAKENLSFANCYASGDRTEKGLVAVNSGYPAQPQSSIIVFPDKVNKLPGLSKELKSHKYHNAFIYGGESEFASMKSYLNMQDFDLIADKSMFPSGLQDSKWGFHDGLMYSKALERIDEMKRPFFSLVMSVSSHEPFDVPYSSPDLPNDKWYKFKNSVRYADKCLNDFIDSCKKREWYKNTIVVLVADHGHEIGLEGIYFFSKEKFHIPMVVMGGALKDELKGKSIETVVSQTIVPKLVLEGIGMEAGEFGWQTGINNINAFAQYAYSNGFGRVDAHGEYTFDNASRAEFFKGDSAYYNGMKYDGKVFQEALIDDFLKK